MRIELPEGIILEVVEGQAKLTSDLKASCPYCQDTECDWDCDLSQVAYSEAKDSLEQSELDEEHARRMAWNGAIDGVESLIVACAEVGVDVGSEKFGEAVQSALDSIGKHYGD